MLCVGHQRETVIFQTFRIKLELSVDLFFNQSPASRNENYFENLSISLTAGQLGTSSHVTIGWRDYR